MKNIFRKILKKHLTFLSKKVVKKHNIEIILITGWVGSGIVRELVYDILSKKYRVRRLTKKLNWDLGLPLFILGYNNKKRNFLNWLKIIIKANFNLLFKPQYPHKLIVDLDTSVYDIGKFWLQSIRPNIVNLLKQNPKSQLLKLFQNMEGSEKIHYLYDPSSEVITSIPSRKFTYSESRNTELKYTISKKSIVFDYQSKKYEIKIPSKFKYIKKYLPPAVAIAIIEDVPLKSIKNSILTFEPHPNQIKKGITNLKRFLDE